MGAEAIKELLGRIDLDDFAEIMEVEIDDGDADTLAGFLYEKMGRVPQGGESVRANGLLLTIEQLSGRRIRRVRAMPESAIKQETENDNESNE